MAITVLEHALKETQADETLRGEEIYNILYQEQLDLFESHLEIVLVQSESKPDKDKFIFEQIRIDLGPYPLTPWLNQSIMGEDRDKLLGTQ